MTYKRDKRRNNKRAEKNFGFFAVDDNELSREKEKARKLRNSAWWKKKCSSGLCYYCGGKVPTGELTMDHVIPLSRGGSSEKFNIVPACKDCNNKKKYLLPVEWKEYLENIKKNKTG